LQEDDVLLFGLADFDQGVDLALVEAQRLEVGRRELGEALLVEGRFEPLECEGAVQGAEEISGLFLLKAEGW
jgi:hypothetical protein